jgi:hypothetical protein
MLMKFDDSSWNSVPQVGVVGVSRDILCNVSNWCGNCSKRSFCNDSSVWQYAKWGSYNQ